MAWERLIGALHEIILYAKEKQVTIAFETEGSYHKKEHLMMQQPKEYERLLKGELPLSLEKSRNDLVT